ncbi:MAG: N-acetyltransferase family protein [Saprospiraceae bacterium]
MLRIMPSIALATSKDSQPLLSFALRTFRATYEHLNEPEPFQQYLARHFSEAAFRSKMQHPSSWYFIAKADEEIVGYCKLNIDTAQTEPAETGVEVERIYVDKSQQGQGIGQLFMEKAVAKAKELGRDYIWLGVWEHNAKAIKFYKKNGFTVFGEHTFMMGDEQQMDYMMKKKV